MQRPQHQLEHLAGLRLCLGSVSRHRLGHGKDRQRTVAQAGVQRPSHARGSRKADLGMGQRTEQVAEDAALETVDVKTYLRGRHLYAEQLEIKWREPERDDIA